MKVLDTPKIPRAPSVDAPDKAYQTLAKKLGITPAKMPSGPILQNILATEAIAVYSHKAVMTYLIGKKPDKEHWVTWVPINRELTSRLLASRLRTSGQMEEWNTRRQHGFITTGIDYNKPIPYPVLLAMESIVDRAKEMRITPTFYVSDFVKIHQKPRPSLRVDPFLAVGTIDSDAFFIIERWDEPGFREETYSSRKKKTCQGSALAKAKK